MNGSLLFSPFLEVPSLLELYGPIENGIEITECINCIKISLAIEDRVEQTWHNLHSKYRSDETSDIGEFYPILKLPYRNIQPPTSKFDWFMTYIDQYATVAIKIKFVITLISSIHSTNMMDTKLVASVPPVFLKSEKESGSMPAISLKPKGNVLVNRKNETSSALSLSTAHSNSLNRKHISKPSLQKSVELKHKNESISTLKIILSLAPQYNIENSRQNRQGIDLAIKTVQKMKAGCPVVEIAARKIQIWWKFVFPRIRLLERMNVLKMTREIIYVIVDSVTSKALNVRQKRENIMAFGAAIKIQRHFRVWKTTASSKFIRIQRFFRRVRARVRIRYLWVVTRAAIMAYRFIMKFNFLHKHVQSTEITVRRVISGFYKTIGLKKRKNTVTRCLVKDYKAQDTIEALYRAREESSIRIQSIFRAQLAVKRVQRLRYEIKVILVMNRFFARVRARRMFAKKMIYRKCAVNIQSYVRGSLSRRNIFRQIKAVMTIAQAWRDYRAYQKLKQQLRKIEKPIRIVLHGIRYLPLQVSLFYIQHNSVLTQY